MNFTGERPTLESGTEASIIRYKAILPFCLGKKVFDYGCGIGHGSYFLSQYVRSVCGYDASLTALREARNNFSRENLSFSDFYYNTIFRDYNIVSMVEVIEHIEKEQLEELFRNMSKEIKECVLTTPNGDLYPYHPQNLEERRGFHVWHYTENELKEFFNKFFNIVEIYGCARDLRLFGETYTTYLVYMKNV